jgi:hypothetical protein
VSSYPNPSVQSPDPAARVAALEQKIAATARLLIVLTLAGVVWLGGLTAAVGYLAVNRAAHPVKNPRTGRATPAHPAKPKTKPAQP